MELVGAHNIVQRVVVLEHFGVGIVAVYTQTEAEDDVAESELVLNVECLINRAVGRHREGADTVCICSREEIFKSAVEPAAEVVVAKITQDILVVQFLGREHIEAHLAGIEAVHVYILPQIADAQGAAQAAVESCFCIFHYLYIVKIDGYFLARDGVGHLCRTNHRRSRVAVCVHRNTEDVVVGQLTGYIPQAARRHIVLAVGALLVPYAKLNVVTSFSGPAFRHEVKGSIGIEGRYIVF